MRQWFCGAAGMYFGAPQDRTSPYRADEPAECVDVCEEFLIMEGSSMGHKSLAALHILKILKKYSDKEHLLTQKQIAGHLAREYDVEIERKAIARHLENLTAAGYPIEQTTRGVYIDDEHEFDDSELRLLIDGVLFSKHISERYAKRLVEKLQNLGSVELRRMHGAICRAEQVKRENIAGLFYTIETLGEAIGRRQKVRFVYNEYHIDKKLHPVFPEPLAFIPYQLVAANGHYYVIGRLESSGQTESFRVERITDIEVMGESADGTAAFEVTEYLSEHPYLYAGERAEIKLKMDTRLAGELIDAFGDGFRVLEEKDGKAVVCLQAGLSDMLEWTKRFSEDVEIISPQSLRNRLRAILFPTAGKYFHNEEDRYARALDFLKKNERVPGKQVLHFDGIDLSRREEYKAFTFCTSVALRRNNLTDIGFLSAFPHIFKADIEQNPVSDLSALKGRSELAELILKDTGVEDIGFLTDLQGLTRFEFKGKRWKDVSPLYALFDLQNLTLDAANAMQLDLLKLRRNCPNLRFTIIGIEEDTPLEDVLKILKGDGAFLYEYIYRFNSFRSSGNGSRTAISRLQAGAALDFAQKNDTFTSADLQRALSTGYPVIAAITEWMTEAGYIRKEGSSYTYVGD